MTSDQTLNLTASIIFLLLHILFLEHNENIRDAHVPGSNALSLLRTYFYSTIHDVIVEHQSFSLKLDLRVLKCNGFELHPLYCLT